jgi:uncharacterized protein (DUF1330 family)
VELKYRNKAFPMERRYRCWAARSGETCARSVPAFIIAGMSALIIVDIEVTDPVRYEEYKRLASASIAAHGGRYLVRGGASEVLDGEWTPRRLVVLQFDSVEQAKGWRASPEYAEAKKVRETCARSNMVVVEGV